MGTPSISRVLPTAAGFPPNTRLPKPVAENHFVFATGLGFFGEEGSAQQRLRAQNRKQRRRYGRANDALGTTLHAEIE